MSKLDPDLLAARAAGKPGTQEITIPPDLISAIIEALLPKILQALIDAILGKLKPDTPPPVVINPPPVVVQPPPNIDPGPPIGPPVRPLESYLIAGITMCYHDWFRGDPAQNVPHGTATPHEVELIRQGIRGLPPGSNVQISADPMPHGCIEYPWPALEITERDEVTGDVREYVLTKENPQPDGGPYWIQGGQTESSIYWRSTGHHLILLTPEPANRSSLSIRFRASNGAASNPFGAPWFLKSSGAARRAADRPDAAAMEAEPDGMYTKSV